MNFTSNQIANIERVGYISTTKASMQLHLMEIHDVICALQIEMSTYQTDKKAALAKILWDCYIVMDKRYEKIEDTGKSKGSVSLLLSHWLTLYQFLLEFKYPTHQTDSVLGKIDKLKHLHERVRIDQEIKRISYQ